MAGDSKGPTVIAVAVTFAVWTFIIMCLRLFSRVFVLQKMGLDDCGLDQLDVLLGHIGLRQVVRLSVLYSSRRSASDPALDVACVSSIIRITYIPAMLSDPDATWVIAEAMYWSVIEINVGIFASSIPSFKAIASRFIPRLIGEYSRDKGYSGWSSSNDGKKFSGFSKVPEQNIGLDSMDPRHPDGDNAIGTQIGYGGTQSQERIIPHGKIYAHTEIETNVEVSRDLSCLLPSTDLINGLVIDRSSITTNAVYNASTPGGDYFPAAAAYDFCNVTLTYTHPGRNDKVHLKLWMPAPAQFENRWLSTGGGGFAINHDEQQLPGGVQYGAAAGITDGGFGSFSTQIDQVFLLANGTINYEALYMFGYQAHHELSVIGKALTKNFYGTGDAKLYAYWQGCSEGGREGFSQVQRFQEFDGAVIGAPALRYGQQQTNHLYANVVEHTLKYYPPPCELEKIVNLTIAACDRLDGKADGVVSRTDLCKAHFDTNSTIGAPYSCPASTTTTGTTPAQNGTVSVLGAAAAKKMLDGLRTLDGRRAYIFYQPSSTFDDAQTKYNPETKEFELDVTAYGAEWVPRFLQLQNYTLSSLENVTYDTLKDWMELGWQRYEDVLQTTWPDLTPFQSAGGKVLHYHGESDPSIPAGSSVHYHESVRKTMYPNMSFNASNQALNEWNRLFLVPGAAHCTSSTDQPNGPFPQATLKTLIEWVENNIVPETLNGTVQSGDHKGEQQQICAWPLRPFWKENGTVMDCVYDQASLDTWDYDFDAYRIPLY
ncbi:hypothetical protein APSETT444_009024 [Aspergillus pseudonomiae]